jgi:poly(A) polymerase/tRNA nucleotidyltransferase (CCA-adding enzyme)
MRIPDYVKNMLEKLAQAGFEAYIVGGCVRDLLMGREPGDWDITTNARPEKILAVFPDGKYENAFGTVLVPVKLANGKTQDVVEVTTYRSEQGYSDRRHPDKVVFEDSLEKDLSRRDFAINALALIISNNQFPISKQISNFKFQISNYSVIDMFGGLKDLKRKIIRAVGEPEDRFKEDALRMLRAVRLACQLDFSIEPKTARAMMKMAGGIKFVSAERVRDELIKILESAKAYEGVMMLYEDKLLQYIIPELERGVGVGQSRHHIYSVFHHSVLSLQHTTNKKWQVRLASLLHDIAKPQTKRMGTDQVATFYNHDIVGAKVAAKIMQRLKFARADIERVALLIRYHMFYYNVGEVTESSVRRLIRKVGEENLADLIDLRVADRLGSGVPKAKPYKLRHLEYMFKKVRHDVVSVKMLKINGDDLMKLLNLAPGPKIGAILDVLLSEVIEDQKLNDQDYLSRRSRELNKMDLGQLRARAKEKIEEKRETDDREIKRQFYV